MKTDKLKLKLLAITLVVAVGVSVSSCDDEEYYFSDLVGSWQLVESGGQPVYDYQVDYYTFYSDGTGCYSYYDRRGHLWDEPFLWDIRSGGRLYLSYENPEYGNTMCYYRYDGRYMYFSTSPTFYDYTVYATAR